MANGEKRCRHDWSPWVDCGWVFLCFERYCRKCGKVQRYERDEDGHCTRCGLFVDLEQEEGINSHECPPGFWTPLREPATPAPGAPSGMGAREFAAEHVEWLQRLTPTGSSKAENDPFAFAEAYAAERERQADETSITRLKMEINLRRKAEAEVAQLRQERDALKNKLDGRDAR